jgi:hypothetical protein
MWGKSYPCTIKEIGGKKYYFYETTHLRKLFGPTILQDYFLVRDEYVLAYDYFEQRSASSSSMKLSYVLTGQPGIGTPPHLLNPMLFIFKFVIGKTTYIAYVLIRRLQNKLPTAVQRDAYTFVLFDDQGPRLYSTKFWWELLLSQDTWALSDSSVSTTHPCDAFLDSKALLIQTTSPARHRWKTWAKQSNARTYVMDVWREDEIHALLYVLLPLYHQLGAQVYTVQFAAQS